MPVGANEALFTSRRATVPGNTDWGVTPDAITSSGGFIQSYDSYWDYNEPQLYWHRSEVGTPADPPGRLMEFGYTSCAGYGTLATWYKPTAEQLGHGLIGPDSSGNCVIKHVFDSRLYDNLGNLVNAATISAVVPFVNAGEGRPAWMTPSGQVRMISTEDNGTHLQIHLCGYDPSSATPAIADLGILIPFDLTFPDLITNNDRKVLLTPEGDAYFFCNYTDPAFATTWEKHLLHLDSGGSVVSNSIVSGMDVSAFQLRATTGFDFCADRSFMYARVYIGGVTGIYRADAAGSAWTLQYTLGGTEAQTSFALIHPFDCVPTGGPGGAIPLTTEDLNMFVTLIGAN